MKKSLLDRLGKQRLAYRTFSACSAGLTTLAFLCETALAGTFTLDWSTIDWPADSVGPHSFTITDENGYEVTTRITITRIGGTALAGYPDDLPLFGTSESLAVVWDSDFQAGNIGESTNTVTLELLSGGSPVVSDGMVTEVSDIDAVDNFSTGDRCDFVTLTGNAGNPTLDYKSANAATRSVIIGPGPGSGNTGNIAANQAQCIFNTASGTGSPNSNGDDNGTIIATYPAGTHTMNIAYDESIEAVYNFADMNPAARGGGFYAGTVATIDSEITLEKDTTATEFTSAGETITYTFEITNDGPLPINTGQNIQIQDDKIGTFTCGTVTTDIPVGGTHSCSADYTVTAADVTNGFVTNIAVAGVGTGAQAFDDRLQSNSDTVTVNMSSGPVASCPAGYTLQSSTGYADSVIVTAFNSAQALNIPEAIGTATSNGNSARLTSSQPTLILDMTDLVAEDAIIDLRAAENNNATYSVALSTDNITYTTVETITGGVQDIIRSIPLTVPSGGARYIRFQRTAGSLWVGGLQYSDICASDGSATLTGNKTIAIWDPEAEGLYALPGNDVIYTITSSNTGDGPTDADSIVLIDIMPPEVEFYNADIDGDGPELDPVSFTQTSGAGLSLTYANDVAFSDSNTRPATFADCTYIPTAGGYDPDVTYICFNPKGALSSGTPDPSFSVSFRARIK